MQNNNGMMYVVFIEASVLKHWLLWENILLGYIRDLLWYYAISAIFFCFHNTLSSYDFNEACGQSSISSIAKIPREQQLRCASWGLNTRSKDIMNHCLNGIFTATEMLWKGKAHFQQDCGFRNCCAVVHNCEWWMWVDCNDLWVWPSAGDANTLGIKYYPYYV